MTPIGRAVVLTALVALLAITNAFAEYVARQPIAGFLFLTPIALAGVAAAIFETARPR